MDEEMRVRGEIVERCKAEMLGPGSEDIGGDIEREVISDSPIERYSLGILFPQNSNYELNDDEKQVTVEKELDDDGELMEHFKENVSESNTTKSYVEDGVQDQIAMTNQFLPSAMGLTFFAQGEINSLNISISASTYRESRFKDCCVRIENSVGIDKYYLNEFIYIEDGFIKLKKNITKKDVYELVSGREIEKERPELVSILYKLADLCTVNKINTGYVRNPLLKKKLVTVDLSKEFNQIYINEKGETSVNEDIIKVTVLKKTFEENIFSYTVVLINNQKGNKSYKKCLFQPEIRINSDENNIKFIEHSYMRKRGIGIVNDEDLVYELLYRNKKSYAIGHGVATGQVVNDNLGTGEIYTDFFPSFEVPQLEFSISGLENSGNILSMFELSDLSKLTKKEKISLLNDFCKSYEKWIGELKESSKTIDEIFDKVVKEQITKCIETLNRMKKGVEILSEDDKVYNAFSLMNRAMLMQREHSKLNRGEFDRYSGDPDFPTFCYLFFYYFIKNFIYCF